MGTGPIPHRTRKTDYDRSGDGAEGTAGSGAAGASQRTDRAEQTERRDLPDQAVQASSAAGKTAAAGGVPGAETVFTGAKAPEPRTPAAPGSTVKLASPEAFAQRLETGKDATGGQAFHLVKPRETLWSIAQEHGVTVEALRKANPDVVPESLKIATKLLKVLGDPKTAMGVSSDSVKGLFAAAGKLPVFQMAQIELARQETSEEMKKVASLHPYAAADGSVAAQSMSLGLAINNIGPLFLERIYTRNTNELFDKLMKEKPELAKQLEGKDVTEEMKRKIVRENVSEKAFNDNLAELAPRRLYSGANYDKHGHATETRFRALLTMYPPETRVNPGKLE